MPEGLENVVLKLLQRELAHRTRTAREALDGFLAISGPGAAYPTGQKELVASVKRATAEWPELARRAAEHAMAQASTDVASSPVGATDANKPLLPL